MKKLALIALSLSLLVSVAFAGVAHAGQIQGQAYNANTGAGIPNIQIVVYNWCDGSRGFTRTNSSGYYSFGNANTCDQLIVHYAGDGWTYWQSQYLNFNGYYAWVFVPLTH